MFLVIKKAFLVHLSVTFFGKAFCLKRFVKKKKKLVQSALARFSNRAWGKCP